jgi:hypothetical protein
LKELYKNLEISNTLFDDILSGRLNEDLISDILPDSKSAGYLIEVQTFLDNVEELSNDL